MSGGVSSSQDVFVFLCLYHCIACVAWRKQEDGGSGSLELLLLHHSTGCMVGMDMVAWSCGHRLLSLVETHTMNMDSLVS